MTEKTKRMITGAALAAATIATIIAVVMAQGCAWSRDSAMWISQEDVANTSTVEKIGGNIIVSWAVKSGVLRKYMGPSLDDASKVEVKKAITELDTLAELEEPTPGQKGEAVGYSLRLYRMLGKDVFGGLLPKIMSLIAPLL